MLGTFMFPVGLHRFSEVSYGKKGGFSEDYKSVTVIYLETAVLKICSSHFTVYTLAHKNFNSYKFTGND